MNDKITNTLPLPLEQNVVEELYKMSNRISEDWQSNGSALRVCAQQHAKLAQHHMACVVNLIENAQEADMNKRMGDEIRSDNPPPGGEKDD